MRIQVAFGAPGIERLVDMDLPEGARVADAVRAAGLVERTGPGREAAVLPVPGDGILSGLDPGSLTFAIYGQRALASTPLRDGDRVEVLRPLTADPKAVRRDRAATHSLPRERSPGKPAGSR